MSQILLDTSAYSAFMRGNHQVKKIIQESDEIYMNPVIMGELKSGFIKGGKTGKNSEELDSFLESPRVNMVRVDEETSERYAIILNHLWNSGTPLPTNDIWIAASAMQYGLRLVTLDSHFQKIKQIITNLVR